jgi:hypothetical protein
MAVPYNAMGSSSSALASSLGRVILSPVTSTPPSNLSNGNATTTTHSWLGPDVEELVACEIYMLSGPNKAREYIDFVLVAADHIQWYSCCWRCQKSKCTKMNASPHGTWAQSPPSRRHQCLTLRLITFVPLSTSRLQVEGPLFDVLTLVSLANVVCKQPSFWVRSFIVCGRA